VRLLLFAPAGSFAYLFDPAMEDQSANAPYSILIDCILQLLRLFEGKDLIFEAPISTSRFGPGFEPGSFKTPIGHFRIHQKVGDGAPIGTVFKNCVPVTELINSSSTEDAITSRILWLDRTDLENANTKERYICIHGTNEENLIGRPVSHGGIRMRNKDVIRLYQLVDADTSVKIRA
jgi:lipoprotein-anchoring transpeptidase ErfK/SrfK